MLLESLVSNLYVLLSINVNDGASCAPLPSPRSIKYLNDPDATLLKDADAPLPFVTVSVPPSWNVPDVLLTYKNDWSEATYVTVAVALDTEPVTVLPTANVPVTLVINNLSRVACVTV